MRTKVHPHALDWLLFFLVTFSILWRGGKALDATWMLSLVACALVIVSGLFILRREKMAPSPYPWFAAAAFVCATFFSFMRSSTLNVGFDELVQTVSLFLLFTYALSIHGDRLQQFCSRYARIVSIALLVACAVGFAVYVLQPVSRFVGTFFDARFTTDYWPNAWAEFVLLAWPMLLWSIWCRRSVSGSLLMRVAVTAIPFACLFLSYSRGGLLAAIVQVSFMAAAGLLFFRDTWNPTTIVKRSLSVALVAALVFVAANGVRSRFHETESVLRKVTFSADEGKSSVTERSQFFGQAIMLAREKPIEGFGPYSFRFVQPRLQREVLATSDHPHNVFLKFLMERGVPASLLFLAVLLLCACQGASGIMRKKGPLDPMLTLLLLTGFVGVVAHNLIDYNLQFVGIAAPFWITMGVLPRRTQGSSVASARLIEGIAVLFAVILLFFTVQEGRYLYEGSKARALERKGLSGEALVQYQETDTALFQRDNLLSRSSLLLLSGATKDARSILDRAMSMNSHDYRAWKLQAAIALAEGRKADALDAYERAYEGGRYNDLAITRMMIELLLERPADLSLRRHEFELLLNDFALAMEENSHFIALSANVEELAKICEILAKAFPADASIYRSLAARVLLHADEERQRQTARPNGLLWQ